MADMAPLDAVEDAAGEWPEEYKECRAYGHERPIPQSAKKIRGGFLATLICPRCGREIHQELDSEGWIVKQHPVYPAGYLMPHGTGRIGADGRARLRLQVMRRLTKSQRLRAVS